MHEYRVTKYDPRFRDERGAYLREEWTMARQVGESFAGTVLTAEEYERVETAYAETATALLREGNVSFLTVEGLENPKKLRLAFANGAKLGLDEIEDVVRQMLQERFWCRLEGDEAFLHIGWDYYMYVGVPHLCHKAKQTASEVGLFVEEFISPYHEKRDRKSPG